jgi:hypothetical protein
MKILALIIVLVTTTLASGVEIEFWEPGTKEDSTGKRIISDSDVMRIILRSSIVPAVTEKDILEIVEKYPEKEEEIRKGIPLKEETNSSEITLVLTNIGAEKFYTYTKEVVGKSTGRNIPSLDFKVDGRIVASPTIREPLVGGIVRVVGTMDWKELEEIFPTEDDKVIFDR